MEKISRRNFIGQNAVGARGHDQEGKRVAGQNFYEKLRGFPAAEKAKILAVQPEDAARGAAFSLNNHPYRLCSVFDRDSETLGQ